MRFFHAKLYQKIIFVFFVLIIPVFAINIGINYLAFSFVKNQMIASNQSNADFYAKQLENQIDFIRTQQLTFLNNSDLQKLSFQSGALSPVEEVTLVGKISEQLLALQNTSPLVVNASVYIQSYGKTISTQSGVTRLPNPAWDKIKEVMKEQAQKAVYVSQDALYLILPGNNGKLVSYMELSPKLFNRSLQQLVHGGANGGAAILDAETSHPILYEEADSFLLNAMVTRLRSPDGNSDPFTFHANDGTYLMTSSPVQSVGWKLYTYVPEETVTGPLKKFNGWFFVLSLVCLVGILLFSFSVNRMVHKPLHKLLQAFRRTEIDHLRAPVSIRQDNEFDYIYKSFDHMVDKLKHSIRQNYEQKIALQQSELKQLQSQINPHFLYNGFYNIYRLCRTGDRESAGELAQRLSSYYHFITRSGTDEVELQMEYRNALDYCEIQRIRFSNRIKLQYDELPASLRHFPVPRLIIQPIIENAFEHAFEHSVGGGILYIRIREENSRLVLLIEDDGAQLPDEKIEHLNMQLNEGSAVAEKTGLLNVSRRIRLKYGGESGIKVARSPYGGLCVQLIIQQTRGNGDVQTADY